MATLTFQSIELLIDFFFVSVNLRDQTFSSTLFREGIG